MVQTYGSIIGRFKKEQKKLYYKLPMRKNSVLTCGYFGEKWCGFSFILFGKINSKSCQNIIRCHFSPNTDLLPEESWKIQENNAPIHEYQYKNWLQVNKCLNFKISSLSPYLNPIESLQGENKRKFYEKKRHFYSSVKLKSTI